MEDSADIELYEEIAGTQLTAHLLTLASHIQFRSNSIQRTQTNQM